MIFGWKPGGKAPQKKEEVDLNKRRMLFGVVDKLRGAESAPMAAVAQAAPVLAEANAAFAAGNWAEATEKYKEFLAQESANGEARQRLGECLYRQGRYIQAKVEFERLMQKNHKDNSALLFLGLVLARLERLDKAAVVWKLFFNPHNVMVQRELNLQIGLIEIATEDAPASHAEVADAVEQALEASRKA